MHVFRIFLAIIFLTIIGYTAVVINTHGLGLLPVFFGDIAKLAWPGQFNLDFMCFLALSAVWVSWRHQFSLVGLLLGLIAFFGGALFLSIYLFIQSYRVNGNINELLLGPSRI